MLGEFGTGDGFVRGRREGVRRGGHDRGGLQRIRAGYEAGYVRWTKTTWRDKRAEDLGRGL